METVCNGMLRESAARWAHIWGIHMCVTRWRHIQDTATHYNILQLTDTRTLQHVATHSYQDTATHDAHTYEAFICVSCDEDTFKILQLTATYCNSLIQDTATHDAHTYEAFICVSRDEDTFVRVTSGVVGSIPALSHRHARHDSFDVTWCAVSAHICVLYIFIYIYIHLYIYIYIYRLTHMSAHPTHICADLAYRTHVCANLGVAGSTPAPSHGHVRHDSFDVKSRATWLIRCHMTCDMDALCWFS